MDSTATEPENNPQDLKEEEKHAVDNEDTGAQVAPTIRLEEFAVSTCEKKEDLILNLKAKLYQFDKEGNQWKERRVGNVRFLKHKENGKVQLVMRRSKSLQILANLLDCETQGINTHLFYFFIQLLIDNRISAIKVVSHAATLKR